MTMKKLKKTPFKLNVQATIKQLQFNSEPEKIKRIRHLFFLKENGIIPVTDLIQIIKVCNIHDIFWKLHMRDIKTEDGIFSYGKLLSLCEKCGIFTIDSSHRYLMNEQLEAIYKKLP